MDPEDLRNTADEVLSDPKYAAAEPSLLERAWDRFLDFLNDLLGSVFGGAVGGFGLGWIVLAMMLGLIGFFLWKVLPKGRTTRFDDGAGAGVQVDSTGRNSRREWLEIAEAADADRRFGEAIVARYRAMVAGLAERNELDDDDADTSGERRRAFVAPGERGASFGSATDTFEETVYGGQEPGPEGSAQLNADDKVVMGGRK